MQRFDEGRGRLFDVFAFALSFVLAGCLAPPPEDHSGDASSASPDGTTETDSTTGSPDVADSGPTEDGAVDAPATIDAPDDGTDAAPEGSACGPATCPTGCCDSSGACSPGNTAAGCGKGGALCATCASAQSCDNQACSCGGARCTGCCDDAGVCQSSKTTMCGGAGAACVACAQGQECNASGSCVCNTSSGCTGCCNGNTCEAYSSQSASSCGMGGATCNACSFGNATATCSGGGCGLSSCNTGFGNCDGVASNGCETNLKGTDATNCGTCHHGCLTGGSCSGGMCQPIPFVISGTSNIVDLDTNGTSVVFADTGKQMIAEVDIPGGTPQMLASAGNPDHVIIDQSGGSVYWTDSGNYGQAGAGQVGSGSVMGTTCGSVTVNALANAGSGQFDILTSELGTLLVGVGCVADTTTGISGTLGASLSPRWVFGDLGASAVVFGGAQGPPSATIANQPGVNWVADDRTYGYWATTEPAIRRAPFNAPANVSVVLASPGGAVGGLATDGTYVYYGISSGIYYVPVAGAASATLLTSKPGTHIRYASGALFFLAGGIIYKIATP